MKKYNISNDAAKSMANSFDEEVETYLKDFSWAYSHTPPKWWTYPIVFQLLNSRLVSHRFRKWLAHKTWKEACR